MENHDKANTNYLELKEEHDDKVNTETMTDRNLEQDIVTLFHIKEKLCKAILQCLVLHNQLDLIIFEETLNLRKDYI